MTSDFSVLAEEYVALRRALGYRFLGQGRYLHSFADFLDHEGHHGPVPLTLSVRWATSTTARDPRNPARRLAVIRGFLGHLGALDGATEIPPAGLLGPTLHRTPPHVYSEDEIASLLRAASALAPAGGLRPRCYVTLFGLLACTGLRISEALALTLGDVDLERGVLSVRAGKNGRSRLVPLHPSAVTALSDYAQVRDAVSGVSGGEDAFFRTDDCERLTYAAVRSTFERLRRQLDWGSQGRARVPRIHDLRHRMVVRRLQLWHAEGVDVDRKIAVLATYLGHVLVSDVYWYLTAVPELMSIVADRFEVFAERSSEAS